MSKDLHILIPNEEFPSHSFIETLREFDVKKVKDKEWSISLKSGNIWIDLEKVDTNSTYHEKYFWKVGIHFQSQYTTDKVYTAYNLTYHLLSYLSGSVFINPRDSRFLNYEEFDDYSNKSILQYTSLEKLFKMGVLDKNERLKF